MEGFVGRLKRELASGRREAVNINQLRKVDILEGLAEGELQSILECFEGGNADAGATLCEEGTDADRLYILEEAKVAISSRKGGQLCIHCFQHLKKATI